MYKYFLAVVFFTLGPFFSVQAQIEEEVYSLLKTIPNLDSLIYLAIENSPVVKAQNERVDQEKINIKIAKKSWLDNIVLNAGYTYTNGFSSLSQNAQGNGVESTALQVGDVYQAGINFRLSAFDFIGRRYNKLKAMQDLKIVQYDKDAIERDITRTVRSLYAELVFMESRLQILNSKKQTLFINYQMAEKKFIEGQVDITELSRMLESVTKSEEEYEKGKMELKKKLIGLEILIGVPLR